MKKLRIWLLLIVIFIGLSNFTTVGYGICMFFGEGGRLFRGIGEGMYITQDNRYVYGGGWLKDTLSNPYYKRYILLYPQANRTLYRVHPIQFWKFWRWREYLTEAKWKQPYLPVDEAEAYKILQNFWDTYRPYEGTLPPRTHQDSISAQNPFRSPIRKDTIASVSSSWKIRIMKLSEPVGGFRLQSSQKTGRFSPLRHRLCL